MLGGGAHLCLPPALRPQDLTQFHYGPTVDTWSVGVMAYELILGYPPFAAETKTQVGGTTRGSACPAWRSPWWRPAGCWPGGLQAGQPPSAQPSVHAPPAQPAPQVLSNMQSRRL